MLCHLSEIHPFHGSKPEFLELDADNLQTLAPVVSMEVIAKSILPMLDKLVTDDIPNIRFNVAKTYSVLIDVLRRLPESGTLQNLEKDGAPFSPSSRGTQIIEERIVPNLEKLQKDDDVDVRYFATTAANAATGESAQAEGSTNATGTRGASRGAGGGGEPMNTSP
jgi:serine/threonine-protein phosphatase 2A regulatory subunit A